MTGRAQKRAALLWERGSLISYGSAITQPRAAVMMAMV